ncbi:linoleate 13S-lipoxygenase 3-1, chloroplastic-like protein [Tanacetum coccineum]
MFLSSGTNKLKTGCSQQVVKASLASATDFLEEEVKGDVSSSLKVTATVSVRISKEVDVVKTMMKLPWLYPQNNSLYESVEKGVSLQLVSTELSPSTMKPKLSKECKKDWSKCTTCKANGAGCFSFEVEIVIVGTLENQGPSCKEIAYLPSQTPKGLRYLRAKELKNKRGDGNGHRLSSDRIHDYDTYNDHGNPDNGTEFARPTLGGERNPHPRRCRTGRPTTSTDIRAEKPVNTIISSTYVPRDEALEGTRRTDILKGIWKGVLRNIPPMVETFFNGKEVSMDYSYLTGLYRNLPQADMSSNMHGMLKNLDVSGSIEEIFKFETPESMPRNLTSYIRDDELGRQTLAGVNPVSLEKLKVCS